MWDQFGTKMESYYADFKYGCRDIDVGNKSYIIYRRMFVMLTQMGRYFKICHSSYLVSYILYNWFVSTYRYYFGFSDRNKLQCSSFLIY